MQESTVSQPLKEKLLPRISIRFVLVLTAICAVVMVLFQAASSESAAVTKILSLLILTTVGCFAAYIVLFALASIVSKTTEPIVAAIDSQPKTNETDS